MTLIGIFSVRVRKMTAEKTKAMKELGGMIEESLTAVKLIASFANEKIETEKFRKKSKIVLDVTHRAEVWLSTVVALFKFSIFGYYVYSFYIATIYISKGYKNPSVHYKTYDTGMLLSVLVSFMTGLMMIFGLTPNI